MDGECLTNELNARILGASPHMERFEGAHLGEQLLQKVNTDPASFYWHFTVLGSFYVSKYVSDKMGAIIATSFPCFKLSNGRSYLWHCSRVRNSSDGSGLRLRMSYNSYMAVCFVFGVGESASYRLTIRMVYLCVLYLLQCVFCICCGVF